MRPTPKHIIKHKTLSAKLFLLATAGIMTAAGFHYSSSSFIKKVLAQDEAATSVAGTIDSVTLYSDRALIRRVYDLGKEKSHGAVRFIQLPQTMMSDSIRAQGENATITSFSLKTNIHKSVADNPLQKQIDALVEKRKALNDDTTNYNEQLRLINTFMRLSTAETDKEAKAHSIKTESWLQALQFIEKQRLHYQAKIRETATELANLQKEINRLSVLLASQQQAQKFSNLEVEVSYIKSNAAKNKIFIEYMVSNVSWSGHYDLRGSSEGSDFKLLSHATIRQSTGEAWNNVNITLSTARPSLAMSPSLLRPWRLGADSLKSLSGEANTHNNQGGLDYFESGEGDDAADTSTLAIDLPARESIASDNAEHKVTLLQSDLKGTLSHVAIPSSSNYVFLKAKLKNTSGMPILWPKMNVFLDGSFIGVTPLNFRASAGEEFEVFLGPDQRLQLKRILKKGEVGSSGLFTKTVDLHNEWQIEVANFTKKPRQIIVYDQYPIPADPKISTKFLGSNRSDAQVDANGIITWKLDTKAGEKVTINFSYSLSIPADIWEKFMAYQKVQELRLEQNYDYKQQQNAPSIQRQYNLEKMLRK